MKLPAAASIAAAALAAKQNDSRQLADYCYTDTTGYYNSYYATYDWSYANDSVCPSTYSYYYEKTYSCNGTYGKICESDYYSSSSTGYYDYTTGSYYDNTYGTYTAGYYNSSANAAGGAMAGVAWLLYLLYYCLTPISILLCCLCCCGVFGKKCCWYNCYGCKKEAKGNTVVVVQQPANQVVQQPAPVQPVMVQQPAPVQ